MKIINFDTTTAGFKAHDVRRIDLSIPGHMELLERAYAIYIVGCFKPEQCTPLSDWVESLSGASHMSHREDIIFVTGHNLDDPKNARLDGLAAAIYYSRSHTAEMSYLVKWLPETKTDDVKRQRQLKGLGDTLIRLRQGALDSIEQREGRKLRGRFFEVDDPSAVRNEKNCIDPHEREVFFAQKGAVKLPHNYIQASLSEFAGASDVLNLWCWPDSNGDVPTFQAVYDHTREVFSHQIKDKDFIKSMQSLVDVSVSDSFKDVVNPGVGKLYGPMLNIPVLPRIKSMPKCAAS